MIWIENNQSYQIATQLMFEDIVVADLTIDFLSYTVDINNIEIVSHRHLPYPVKNDNVGLFEWLLLRGLIAKTHRNIFLSNLCTKTETRDFRLPFVWSLSINAISISDKYWLNPKNTESLIVNGASVFFEKKMWCDVEPFTNEYKQSEIDNYGLFDCFFIEKPEGINPRSLIWSTRGQQNKRWLLDRNGYYLEKKLQKSFLDNELQTLEFFASHGVIVPEHEHYYQSLDDKNKEYDRIYRFDTIQEGLYIIQKRCLVDSNSYLEALIDYVENDDIIELSIRRMFNHYNIPENETERFIHILKDYQLKFDIKDSLIKTDNIGLLINNDCACPVVWGRLKRERLCASQLEY